MFPGFKEKKKKNKMKPSKQEDYIHTLFLFLQLNPSYGIETC